MHRDGREEVMYQFLARIYPNITIIKLDKKQTHIRENAY